MNGIDLILADHERVNDLFDRFEATGDATLVGQIVDALTAHDDAEQAALYPLVGVVLGDEKLIERSARAHSQVKKLIEHLRALEGAPLVDTVTALRTAVTDHVADEERNLLPKLAKKATPEQLDGLAARIEQVKTESRMITCLRNRERGDGHVSQLHHRVSFARSGVRGTR